MEDVLGQDSKLNIIWSENEMKVLLESANDPVDETITIRNDFLGRAVDIRE
jgi:hypothetical protein